jgi:microcystin-dependent protein
MSNARNLANLLSPGAAALAAAKVPTITAASITDPENLPGQDDKIVMDSSSVATVTVNSAVSSSTTVAVDGVSGTIAVGMVVTVSDTDVRSISDASSETAVSVDNTLTITAVASQTSFTVSEAVSIADNVVLILKLDAGDKLTLDASAASTDVGEEFLYEAGSGDASFVLSRPAIISQLGAAPAGTISAFGSVGNSPHGWLPCDGRLLVRTTYIELFRVITTTWGHGDGATTFAVPDLRGGFLRGQGIHGSSTDAATIAYTRGNAGTFENDQFQSHFHTLSKGESNQGQATGGRMTHGTNGDAVSSTVAVTVPTEDTTNSTGTPRTGASTHPFNASVQWIIATGHLTTGSNTV